MRVIVTGAAGFLGSHLCEKLLSKGFEVVGIDNFYTGVKSNLEKCLESKNFELIRHDITFPIYLECDAIFNLACPASPIHYQRDPVQTLKTSVHGSINMLGLAKRTKSKILQASTSEVYGDPKVHPQPESYWGNVNPLGPRACYDEGKRAAETLFLDYHRQYGVDIKIVRIFNTYGPRMAIEDGRVVSNFIVRALKNQPITIAGDGSQTRSFCYVDDLITGMIDFFEEPNEIGPINLGTPHEFTISELANQILELTESKSEVIYIPLPEDDPKQRKPDLSLAQKTISWQPTISHLEGLQKTIRYFQDKIK
jgi:UDP-glucuronate decarboxylase